jgi:hypothetical protein
MAKEATVRKAKAKKAKAKKINQRTSKPATQLLEAEDSVTMAIHDVAIAFQLMAKRKHLGRFIKAAKEEFGARRHPDEQLVSIGAETANFVKKYLARYRMYDDSIGMHIVEAKAPKRLTETASPAAATVARRNRFRCDFGRGNR